MKTLFIALLILPYNIAFCAITTSLTLHVTDAKPGDTLFVSYTATALHLNYEEVLLTLDSTLTATLPLNLSEPREITISLDAAEFLIYMEPGDILEARLNAKTPLTGAVFSGSAASAAVLYVNFQHRFGTFIEQAVQNVTTCMQLDPKAYLQAQDEIQKAQLAYLEKRRAMVSETTCRQLYDRITYTALMNKLRYPVLRCFQSRVSYAELYSRLDSLRYFAFADRYQPPKALPALSDPVCLALWELNRLYYQQQRGGNEFTAIDELQCVEQHFTGETGEFMMAYTLTMQFATGMFSSMDTAFAFVCKRLKNKNYIAILTEQYQALRALQPGNPAPVPELTLFNGKAFRLDSLRGKTVLMEFWHSGCAPCLEGFAPANELFDRLPENVVMVYVCADTDSAQGRKTVRKFQVEGIHVHAPGFRHPALQAYRIQSFPTWVLIAPDGTIINANAPRPGNKKLEVMLLNPE
jgi:thiol-disulfide isomerase/thioredoxin